ncbi:uncharacterized protein LOC9642816 [Selaginella moellendorffii]|nr:uncharacterized protein LOC9642816 [Selaginella moellendorffii]|eukprot:XP_002973599.2 uncharacterized protein LOC9642816 [Selaginella moellendorffii]
MAVDLLASVGGPWPTVVALAAGIIIPWIYLLLKPPPPKICGTRRGPPITAPRIRLRDGRYMAYKEQGVPKDLAKHKVIFVHPFSGSRHSLLQISQEVLEGLSVYMVAFDRAGYGESDPFPERSVKSEALDIQELADQLQLGQKFYVVGLSMGGYPCWACLKHIPHRLAGVAMMAPVVNYWWPSASKEISGEAFSSRPLGDKITLRIAHYAPWLMHTWSKQTFLPSFLNGIGKEKFMNKMDLEITAARKNAGIPHQETAIQQGTSESLHRDLAVGFGKWDFFLANAGVPVHVFQGDEDNLVPVSIQRHVAEKLPWINYHELPGVGHLLDFVPGLNDKVLTTLLAS